MSLPAFLIDCCKKDLSLIASEKQLSNLTLETLNLPDINKIGFEFPLMGKRGIDLHLNLRRDDNLNLILKQLKNTLRFKPDEWKPLLSLIELWMQEGNIVNENIEGIFLEFDTSSKSDTVQLPSVFFRISSKHNKDVAYQLTEKIILQLKGNEFYQKNKSIIEECIFQSPEKSFLYYVGLMLSRPIDVIRLNMHQIEGAHLLPFLEKNGWRGDKATLQIQFDNLTQICDEVIVSFDCHENKILPRIGLEASISNPQNKDPRWEHLLTHLIEKNLCSEDAKNLILNWQKKIYPFNVEAWNETLILNSLLKPATQFELLKQVLSHIKITVDNKELQAKGYLGFGQTWEGKQDAKQNALTIINNSVEQAIEKSIRFLYNEQQQSGYWRDYLLVCGTSDQWPTAYIGSVMASCDNTLAKKSAEKAWQMLKYSYRKEGWANNFMMPADPDSTAWTLILARDVGDNEFFSLHKNILSAFISNNKVKTYLDEKSIRKWAKIDADRNIDGWLFENDCVLAAMAIAVPEITIPLLLQQQQEEGFWKSYWWTSNIYATAYSILALKQSNMPIPRIEQLCEWLQQQSKVFVHEISKGQSCNVFYLSLLSIACIELNILENIKTFVDHIISQQFQNGKWKGCSEMKCPFPEVKETKTNKDNYVDNDQNGTMTTATALRMLVSYKKLLTLK